jgi:transposase InsO family protein
MADLGLVGAHSRKKWRRGRPDTAPAGDLLERDFTSPASDLRWVADISEFKCVDGKLFLAGIMDLHDRGICGWSMGERQTTGQGKCSTGAHQQWSSTSRYDHSN